MHLSKFEKLCFTQMSSVPFDLPRNGRAQRNKIPRTTRIKRDWKRSKSPLSLKAWVRSGECNQDDVGEWIAVKGK